LTSATSRKSPLATGKGFRSFEQKIQRLLQTALMGSWVSGRPLASHSLKKMLSPSAGIEAPHIAEGAFLLLLTARL
jgi:hypothetical protein